MSRAPSLLWSSSRSWRPLLCQLGLSSTPTSWSVVANKARISPATATLARLNSSDTSSSSFVSRIDSDFVVHSPAPDINIPRQHFFDFVWSEADGKHPDRTAIFDYVNQRHISFTEGKSDAIKTAAALKEMGMEKGDVLALFLPNCPEYTYLMTGAALAGGICTTINPTYTPGEICRQLQLSHAKAVATFGSSVSQVEQALDRLGAEKKKGFPIIVLDGGEDITSKSSRDGPRLLPFRGMLAKAGSIDVSAASKDYDYENGTVVMPFSSGTTGAPKGVELTHQNLIANACQLVYSKGFEFVPFPTDTFQPRTICVLPFFHIFAMNVVVYPMLHVGGETVLMPGFEPISFIKALEEHKPDFLYFVPPLVAFCASHPSVTPAHLECVKFVFVGAAPVGQALIDKFKEKAPNCIFREGWGMTELSPVGIMTPLHDEVKGSCGFVVPNAYAKIVDMETHENLGPGKRGELCIKGPLVMKGYLNNPEATKSTISPDGWLHSGDIAYYDEAGHFFIVDRLKELIKVKGFQVPPAELEDLLRAHPSVADVAVVGVPHERTGEAPRAYVVKAPGSKIMEDELCEYVASEVTAYKRLTGGLKFVDAIPKSPSGKILRKDLVSTFDE